MSDRYCIREMYTEQVLEHKTTHRLIKKWLFEYNDGTFETLTMTEVFKNDLFSRSVQRPIGDHTIRTI